jgi:hypothetical protein
VVFNTASQDVTLFDTASNEVTGSQPTDAVVRWLSNEQHYWDGESIWTYDFPENELRAVAIDPRTFEVIKQVPVDAPVPVTVSSLPRTIAAASSTPRDRTS